MDMTKQERIAALEAHAKHIRIVTLKAANHSGTNAHLGGILSILEALTVLYGAVMNDRKLPYEQRDKFILSKGHAALSLYAALAVMKPEIGLEASSGSLGQGISMAVGLALAAKKKGYAYQSYVLCGNGEANEGSVWEACMSAVNFGLDNFTLFLDDNRYQGDGMSRDVMNISDKYPAMLKALGFQVIEIDGNNVEQIYDAFMAPREPGKPKAIVGTTVKGKGVSFMENNNDWHHNRLTDSQLAAALSELEAEE